MPEPFRPEMPEAFRPDPEHLDCLRRVVGQVGRAHRLPREDAEDLLQLVYLKAVKQDYAIFRQFRGRSTLDRYLTVVVVRVLLDWRNAERGRWRPSAAAARLGPVAVTLERLVTRDGHTVREAAELASGSHPEWSPADVQRLAAGLPLQRARRQRMPLPDDAGAEPFRDPVERAEEWGRSLSIRRALARALGQLSEADRQLLRARFGENRSIRALADQLRVEPKRLYRRLERVLETLRGQLAAAG